MCYTLSLIQFLEKFDTDVIPHDYPEVSSKAGDRTTIGALSLIELQATLTFVSAHAGWMVDPDREMVKITTSLRYYCMDQCKVNNSLQLMYTDLQR